MLYDGLSALNKLDYEKAVACFKEEKEYVALAVFLTLYCQLRTSSLRDIPSLLKDYHVKFNEVLFYIKYLKDEELQDKLMDIVGEKYVKSMHSMLDAFVYAYSDVSKSYLPFVKKDDKEVDALYHNMRSLYECVIPMLRDGAYSSGDKMFELFNVRYRPYLIKIWAVGVFADAYGGKESENSKRDIYCERIRAYSPKFEFPEYVDFSHDIDKLNIVDETPKKVYKPVIEEEVVPEGSIDLGRISKGVLSGIYITPPDFLKKYKYGNRLEVLIPLAVLSVIFGVFFLSFLIRKIIWIIQVV